MRITLRVLGLEMLDLSITTDDQGQDIDEPGDCLSSPVGFTLDPGDQRWQSGVDFQ